MNKFLLFGIIFIIFIGIAVIIFVILAKTGHFNIFNKIKSIFSKNTTTSSSNPGSDPGGDPGSDPGGDPGDDPGGSTDLNKCLQTAVSYCPGNVNRKSNQESCCDCMRKNLHVFEKVPSCSNMGASGIVVKGSKYDKFVANYCDKESSCYYE